MKNQSDQVIDGVEPGGDLGKLPQDRAYRLFRAGAVSWDDYAKAHVTKPRKTTKKKAAKK